jgi:hypothetical protein
MAIGSNIATSEAVANQENTVMGSFEWGSGTAVMAAAEHYDCVTACILAREIRDRSSPGDRGT